MSKLNATHVKMLPVCSRHALFHTSFSSHTDVTNSHELITDCQLRHRDREPSRIPVKWLISKFRKSRKIRNQLKHTISKSIPKSSQIHYFIQNVYTSSRNTQMNAYLILTAPRRLKIVLGQNVHKSILSTIFLKVSLQMYFMTMHWIGLMT
jgi:hypothetical protein